MKKLFFVVFIMLTSLTSWAQQYQDVVYLKNGSIIRGMITEQIPLESIKIESQGNVFVFKLEEIEKIVKEQVASSTRTESKERPPKEKVESGLKKGYHGLAELAFGVAYGDDVDRVNEMIKINMVNGFRINPHFAVGLSTGVRFLMRDDIYLVPIMGDIRINVINRRASPYFALALGSAFNGTQDFARFGTMFGFGFGGAIKVGSRNTINIGLSYESIGASDNDFFMSDVWIGAYRSFGINMGFTF